MRCSTLRRVLIFGVGVGVGLNVLTGTAFATPSITHDNPSDAKFDCGTIDNLNQVTGHGANNNDGYQSTCDPADFGGNGQEFGPGNQTGKPCAGCVGRADDKNPPGQYPDGSDNNSGYECDGRDRPFVNQNGNGNHGVGDENPAHTGCESTVVTPPPDDTPTCPDGSTMTDTDGNGQINAADCNHSNNPGGGDNVGDNTGGGNGGGEVLGNSEEIVSPPPVLQAVLAAELLAPTVPAEVTSASVTAAPAPAPPAQPTLVPANTTLAFTGVGQLTGLLALAAAFMIALGALLVRAARRPAMQH